MAHYRKITVRGVEHQYVISATIVKIRGVGVFPKESIGEHYVKHQTCECCDQYMWEIYGNRPHWASPEEAKAFYSYDVYEVRPAHIAKKIEEFLDKGHVE